MEKYQEFIESKRTKTVYYGHDINESDLNPNLAQFQIYGVKWAIKRGRAALFEDTGLGKTIQQLAWAFEVARHTSGSVLIFAPLGVTFQTIREAAKFGFGEVKFCRNQDDVIQGVNITNYEKLDKFDVSSFAGVVLDESSVLKAYMSKTKQALIEACSTVNYRLACTATPSPNDYLELGNHAQFLGVMASNEMIMRFFQNNTMEAGGYDLKPHAAESFWQWCATWSLCISNPSDIGFDGSSYILPALNQEFVEVSTEGLPPSEGELFRTVTINATSIHKEGRITIARRANAIVDLAEKIGYNFSSITQQGECRGKSECNKLGIHEGVLQKEPGEIQINTGTKRQEECRQTEEVRGRPSVQINEESGSYELSGKKSSCKEVATTKNIQPIIGTICSVIGETTPCLRDMRNDGQDEQEGIPGSGSLPQNEQSSGADLQQLQSDIGSRERRAGCAAKCNKVLVESLLIWCNTNYEQDEIERQLTESGYVFISIRGSDDPEKREIEAARWLSNEIPIMITKPSIYGAGMNFQHCRNMAFVGLSYSYEDYYQAIRRCWRFGQKREVNCYVMAADSERCIIDIIKKKEEAHTKMKKVMTEAISNAHMLETLENNTPYFGKQNGDNWELHHGDCVHVAGMIEDDSIGFSVYSPPFSNLYIYSDSEFDMGNSTDDGQFFKHYSYLAEELYRITKPGRLTAIHCKDLPMYKGRDGAAGLRDFPGEIIKMYESKGWVFHSRVTIWKDPVIEMQRTKNHGLLYKQLCKDSAASRQGMADYMIVMRKWGDESLWEPVTTGGERFFDYMGSSYNSPTAKDVSRARSEDERARLYSIAVWQRYASPVWFDIDMTDVLNYKLAKEKDEERHICPLQLGVIERAVELWSNPGDVIFSPFTGIGSEGVMSLKAGRKFKGSELKKSYFDIACRNLEESKQRNGDLFANL